MKILMINSVCGIRSTGRICTDLATALQKSGHTVKIAYGRLDVPQENQKYAIRIGTNLDVILHGLKARIFDDDGFGSESATKKFVQWVRKYDPDIIHLHNLHGYYINIKILFHYLKESKAHIIWTLHDCWAFTGHCAYFDYVGCKKWITGCYKCALKREYPSSLCLDQSKKHYRLKRELIYNLENLTIITPSNWLKELAEQSYLGKFPVRVIHNGIDTNVFKYKESNLRDRLNLHGKKVILGVASTWNERKGLGAFVELSKKLNEEYRIVLVGLSKKQISKMPSNILGISQTNSTIELAEYYSLADVFVNPTLEDNYPTTNLEAIACGTPVITYNTGGSSESASTYGIVVEKGNVDELEKAILNIQKIKLKTPFSLDYCDMVKKYLKLYKLKLDK